MTYRVRRKFISTKFCIDDQICKVFLHPEHEYRKGCWFWKVGFAVGKSNRQLNDWFHEKKNKRARSIHKQMTGKTGIKAVIRGFKEILKLRWSVQPGDCIECDCTSYKPEQQFKVGLRFVKNHPEWVINYDYKAFYWYRPPYPDDSVWKSFDITPITPVDRVANTAGEKYFDCFRVKPKGNKKEFSMEETLELVGQILPS